MKHIQQETRCRVQIKGRGSGFMEHGTGQESDEEMYLHVALVFLIFETTNADILQWPRPR